MNDDVVIGMLNFDDDNITKLEAPKIPIDEWNKLVNVAKKIVLR